MKVLITGGAGFIGSHIVEDLLKKGNEVVIFDNFSSGLEDNLKDVINDCEIVKGDIADAELLTKSMKGVDMVSHHAAQLEIFRSTNDPRFDLDVNTVGTLNVLNACVENGVSKLINISSACIYGQVEGVTNEDCYPRPNWAYGVSKLAAEKYCDIYNDYKDLPVVSLRYGIVYGEREWYRRVLTIFLKKIMNNESPVVFGDGNQIRDFINVADVVDFNWECMTNDAAVGEAYNVGTGKATTVKELAQTSIDVSGKDLEIIFENTAEGEFSKLVPEKRRNFQELKTMLLGMEKAKKELNWQPKVSLANGLLKELNWIEKVPSRWDKLFFTEHYK